MKEFKYYYKSDDGEELVLTANYEVAPPPNEVTYNYKKYYLILT